MRKLHWVAAVLLGCTFLLAGCAGQPRRPTVAEWLQENTLILEQLRSYDRKERSEGIHRFLRLGQERGTEVVTFLLNDPALDDYRIELVLARILAEWKDARAIPYLIRNLKSRDTGAVEIAREGLIVFRDEPRILVVVSELLTDPDPTARSVAAGILSEMSSREAVELLAGRLQGEEDREIRAACLMGILGSGHARRTAFLIDALSDPEPEIRGMAWEAIASKSPPARFDPEGDPAERAQAVLELRRWARADPSRTTAGARR